MRTIERLKSASYLWIALWRRISQTGANPSLPGSRSLERDGRNEFWTASTGPTSSLSGWRALDRDATPHAARRRVLTEQLRDSAVTEVLAKRVAKFRSREAAPATECCRELGRTRTSADEASAARGVGRVRHGQCTTGRTTSEVAHIATGGAAPNRSRQGEPPPGVGCPGRRRGSHSGSWVRELYVLVDFCYWMSSLNRAVSGGRAKPAAPTGRPRRSVAATGAGARLRRPSRVGHTREDGQASIQPRPNGLRPRVSVASTSAPPPARAERPRDGEGAQPLR